MSSVLIGSPPHMALRFLDLNLLWLANFILDYKWVWYTYASMIKCCKPLCAGIMGYGCGFRSFLRELRMEGLHAPTRLESNALRMKAAIQSKLQVNVTKTRPNETDHYLSWLSIFIISLCLAVYMEGFITAASNLPGNIFTILLMDRIGGKILLC